MSISDADLIFCCRSAGNGDYSYGLLMTRVRAAYMTSSIDSEQLFSQLCLGCQEIDSTAMSYI